MENSFLLLYQAGEFCFSAMLSTLLAGSLLLKINALGAIGKPGFPPGFHLERRQKIHGAGGLPGSNDNKCC
jgi:hypothetical protein